MIGYKNILAVQSSARRDGSVSRRLVEQVTEALVERNPAARVVTRDVANGLPVVNEVWLGANSTPAPDRTPEQRRALKLSDALVEELKASDVMVFGVPVYNFGVPASLKAWVDLVARVGLTFRYSEAGPIGLLENKRAILLMASGGMPIGAEIDFASTYMRHVLGFIGVTDVSVVAADQLMQAGEDKIATALELAQAAVETLVAA